MVKTSEMNKEYAALSLCSPCEPPSAQAPVLPQPSNDSNILISPLLPFYYYARHTRLVLFFQLNISSRCFFSFMENVLVLFYSCKQIIF